MAAARNRDGSKKITTGKAKSIAREIKSGTPSHKTAKQSNSFVNQYSKDAKKTGSSNKSLTDAASKSVSPRQKTVPVKPRGGRGGGMSGGVSIGKVR